MAADNPFSPTFGASPPPMVGRDDILESVDDALATGPTHPDYTTLCIGVRGAGKTVILNAVEDLARGQCWLTIAENPSPNGLLNRLNRRAHALLEELDGPEPQRRLTGVKAGGIGVEFDLLPNSEPSRDLREVLTDLGSSLADNGTGLLITLDELQSGDLDEMREFGAVLQHVTRREQHPIASPPRPYPRSRTRSLLTPPPPFFSGAPDTMPID